MSLDRKSVAFLLGLLACRLIAASNAFAISAGARVTTADVSTDACSTPVVKTAFSASDARAYLWLDILGPAVGDTVEWRWVAPGDAPYATSQYEVPFTTDGCAWAWIDINGQAAATKPGKWRVDVYLNGTLAFSNNFTIGGGTPTPGNAGAAHLDFSVTDQVLAPWSYSALSYRIKSFKAGLGVDLYLAMLLDGEGNQCVSPESVFTYSLPPFVTGLALANTQADIFAGKLPARVNDVALTLYGVLVATGTSPADSANWVSNVAALDLAMGTLSSPQNEVIADRGNPPAFIIDFDRARGRRVETWIYPQGNFQFINGAVVGTPDDGERASGSARPAARYSPGRFSPATTRQEIRALLGDPDHVIRGSVPGRSAWIFDGAGLTVTLEGGVIRRVEVY
jgi:hypothetical protein